MLLIFVNSNKYQIVNNNKYQIFIGIKVKIFILYLKLRALKIKVHIEAN